ncbi:MAG: rod shape-determining protein MreD [Myxococcales bacterium]|nr:rod shape-determining protein MreD [Myxococcales bacterium]
MQPFLRSVAILLLGLGLLVLESTVARLVPLHPFTPHLVLPIVLFLGVSPDVHLVRGAGLAFFLGYLLDVSTGNRMGLQTFVCVATFTLARGAGLRLFLRSPSFQIALTFVIALLAGGTTLALRAIFSPASPFPSRNALETSFVLAASALATGLAAPVVFGLVQRIEARLGRQQEADV